MFELIVKENGKEIFNQQSDSCYIEKSREVKPKYKIGGVTPDELEIVRGSNKTVVIMKEQ